MPSEHPTPLDSGGVRVEGRAVTELGHGVALAGYRIEALIGRGSTGSVYSAEDVALKRRVALKRAAAGAGARRALPRAVPARVAAGGARSSTRTSSRSTPSARATASLFLAMRYVDGGDLAALLGRVGRLDPERALRICEHVAAALDAAHAHGLVHRDVKPGNVLLAREDDEDYAYLCDFGLAKHGASVTSLTGARDIVGTVGYLSPEQIDGLPVDGRTDVYALGCLLFECLAGEPPFVRENELATILAHRSEPPPRVVGPAAGAARGARRGAGAGARQGPRGALRDVRRAGARRRRALAGGAVEAPPPATHAGPAVHTFVFADIRGYTAYMREHGDEVGAQLAQRFAGDRRGARARARRDAAAAARRRGARRSSTRRAPRCATRSSSSAVSRRTSCRAASGSGSTPARRCVAADDLHGGGLNRAARLCAPCRRGRDPRDRRRHAPRRPLRRRPLRAAAARAAQGLRAARRRDRGPSRGLRRRATSAGAGCARALRGRGVRLARSPAAAVAAAGGRCCSCVLAGGGGEEGTRVRGRLDRAS